MPEFKVKIINPRGVVFEGKVLSATLDTPNGQITILANHRPLVSVLGKGEMVIRDKDVTREIFVWGGFLEFSRNELNVLAHSAEYVEQMDLEMMKTAKEKAEGLLADQVQLIPEYEMLLDRLNREKKKIELFNKWQKNV